MITQHDILYAVAPPGWTEIMRWISLHRRHDILLELLEKECWKWLALRGSGKYLNRPALLRAPLSGELKAVQHRFF